MVKYLDFKSARCKNCYKCLKECPVKAIKIENNQAVIIEERCILCGRCTLVCPQNAKEVHSELDKVVNLLKTEKVVASVAPSFVSNFNIKTFEALAKGLNELGFSYAEETARGAALVTAEYEKLLKTKQYKNFITSCCPAANTMIRLYFPDALKYLAPVDSPVIAHAKLLKEENKDAKIIFIGPCIAKKRECLESGLVDGVLTFEELARLFDENDIKLHDEEANLKVNYNKARFYPISRGIIKSFKELRNDYEYIAVDGVARCKEVLGEIEHLENVFLEINTCPGSCVNGPCKISDGSKNVIANSKIRKYVSSNMPLSIEKEERKVDLNHQFEMMNGSSKEPTEEQIKAILSQTGKFKKEDELNCGACGYSSCREKAWAVFNGYADIEMCVPYMRDRAENVSYEIMKHNQNGIIVIDQDFRIVEINNKAMSLLGYRDIKLKEDVIFNYLDNADDFVDCITEEKNLYDRELKIEKTNKYVELSITNIQNHNLLFATMKDITEKVNYNKELEVLREKAAKIADDVIKKQMRTAQEIASLLGETTAESKVALVNLKKTLKGDEK